MNDIINYVLAIVAQICKIDSKRTSADASECGIFVVKSGWL